MDEKSQLNYAFMAKASLIRMPSPFSIVNKVFLQ